MRPRVAFETLGCKLNQYETDAVAAQFRDLGWDIVDPDQEAEAYVVNTCTVTDKADRKSRRTLGQHLGKGRDPVVVVTGCFAESARESLEGREGITYVVSNRSKNQIAVLVDAHVKGEAAPELPRPDPFGFAAHDRVFHTRASLKIQDGCDNFCSFCIIPAVRGRAVSRPEAEILSAARELLAGGRKELVVTGVNLGRWKSEGRDFTDLAAALLDLPGDFRLRITSLEPDGLDQRFAALLAHPKMAPHLHLCLQSASPRLLLAMRREYSWDDYLRMVGLVRAVRSDVNLTTDLIVGFPGETDADFERSLAAAAEVGFGHVHVFPYSRRQDTRAERMPDQVAEAEKTRRSRRAQDESAVRREARMRTLLGRRRTVLVETPNTGRTPGTRLRGLTEDYFPCRFTGRAGWNTFAPVVLTGVVLEGGEWVFEAQEAGDSSRPALALD